MNPPDNTRWSRLLVESENVNNKNDKKGDDEDEDDDGDQMQR